MEAVLAFFAEVSSVAPPTGRADVWIVERLSRLIAFDDAAYDPVDPASPGPLDRCDGDRSHLLRTPIPVQGRDHRALELVRCGRDYTEHERLLFDAVRPALIAYEAHRVLANRVSEVQSRPHHAVGHDLLSPREEEVLDLVGTGATNAEIAERLSIAAATVRKHLEHIYLKLAVGSRTAALARTGRSSGVVGTDDSGGL